MADQKQEQNRSDLRVAVDGDGRPPRTRATEALEQLVDEFGLSRVLEYLASVCDHKAEHVLTHYPSEEALVKQWDDAAQVVQDASASTAQLQGGRP